ncbi:MAG: molybdopterin dinucleotide binding domain-containing protein, partial [Myxococcota bacterium]|nr:molybdopterin dinucleotide binding domain-containing protein [Myxococcota bacterium]
LRLVSTRHVAWQGGGTRTVRSPRLRHWVGPPRVRLGPGQAADLGLAAGARAEVVRGTERVRTVVEVDRGVPSGVAVMNWSADVAALVGAEIGSEAGAVVGVVVRAVAC